MVSDQVRDAEGQRLWRLAAMGGTMASEILAGALIGWLLDRVFGTAPTLLVIFLVAGVIIAMAGFIHRAMKETKASAAVGRRVGEELERDHPDHPDHPAT